MSDTTYTEMDFTQEFCEYLVSEYGTIEAASEAIAPFCRSSRLVSLIVKPRTVQTWMSKHVGPVRRAREVRRAANAGMGVDMSRPDNDNRLNRIDDLLERANVPIESIGAIAHTRLKAYSGFHKGLDENGKPIAVRVPMYSTSIDLKPIPKALVEVPTPSIVTAYKLVPRKSAATERIFVVGDMQIGFFCCLDPNDSQKFSFVPFHDENAIDIMLQAMALYAPDTVVIVGDYFDFPQLSKFQQEVEFSQTMQATVDYGESLIAKMRATVGPKCKMLQLLGNHETRMQRAITNNLPALYNLRRPGEKHALYSVPSLLRLEHHNVEISAEYPSGQFWLAERRGNIPGLVVTHADPKKQDMRADSIHGHLVLPEIQTFAREYREGWVTYVRLCVSGTSNYSDTGDKVRITRTNTPSGRARMASLQSFGTVDIDRESGQRKYGLHIIRDGAVQFEGRVLAAQSQALEAA